MAFRAAGAVFGTLPRPISYVLVAIFVALMVRMQPGRYAGLSANLRHVLPGLPEAEFQAILRSNARNHALAWVDFFRIPRLSETRKRALLKVDGENNVKSLIDAGLGCVIASIHFGAWEGCMAFWGGTRSFRTALVAEIVEPPEVWAMVRAQRNSAGIEVFPLARSAARDMLKLLRGNGVVVSAMDRDILGTGKPFQFFGATASIPTGLVEVAQRTGAGLVPTFCLRDRLFGYRLIGLPAIFVGPGEEGVVEATAALLRHFEAYITKYPEQWHVLDPIWGQDDVARGTGTWATGPQREEVAVG